MRIKVRIYNPYDLDIIALAEAPNFSVPNAMKQTLKYYAAGKRYLVEIPTLTEHLKSEQYVKGFYVELDDEKDKEAVAFIKTIPDGLRNSFMKNIFRASFEVSPVSLYMGDGGAEYVARMIANPRYGRHPVQREVIDPIHLAEGEIGVTISESTPDVKKLPRGRRRTQAPQKKTADESLREVTRSAYTNASKLEEEKEQQRKSFLAETKDADADLDALLDSMM